MLAENSVSRQSHKLTQKPPFRRHKSHKRLPDAHLPSSSEDDVQLTDGVAIYLLQVSLFLVRALEKPCRRRCLIRTEGTASLRAIITIVNRKVIVTSSLTSCSDPRA